MKRFFKGAGALAAVMAVSLSWLCTSVFAIADSGFTYLEITRNPDCYAEITVEGDHFTVDGRSVKDPVHSIGFSRGEVEMSNFEFTAGEDYTFHAEFDAVTSEEWCNFCLVCDSKLLMTYRIQHDENGWYFPDNGLAKQNAEKLENIQLAIPEAAAYYISQTADEEEIQATLASLEEIVQEVCGDEEDEYVKAYLLFRWEVKNIYYDKDAAETEVTLDTVAVHNVLERRRTTCAGYSNTYCALLETAGIRSVNLKGAASTGAVLYEELLTIGENHEFTAFWYEAENRWVYVDPTWGSNGRYENGVYRYEYPPVDRYFDVTDEALALNHRIDKVEERHYTEVLQTEEETEETTTQPPETEETQGTETTTTATTTTRPPVTTQTETAPKGSYAVYAVTGIAGVAIVITGIILLTRNKK